MAALPVADPPSAKIAGVPQQLGCVEGCVAWMRGRPGRCKFDQSVEQRPLELMEEGQTSLEEQGTSAVTDGSASDDESEPPMAPPEEEEVKKNDSDEDEPPWAPPEDCADDGLPVGVVGGALELHRCQRLLTEVYAGSCDIGTSIAMDAVRDLHPHWNQGNVDTEIGRRVKWVRTTNDWVYGELAAASFLELLPHISPQSHEVFVDLGSGTGKVAAMASLHFGKSVGLELQDGLHREAEALAAVFQERIKRLGVSATELLFFHADFFGEQMPSWTCDGREWWDVADVAYACSPKFCSATMHGLSERAARMRPGSRFVTVRHPLQSSSLKEIWRGIGRFNWGEDDLIVYRRE